MLGENAGWAVALVMIAAYLFAILVPIVLMLTQRWLIETFRGQPTAAMLRNGAARNERRLAQHDGADDRDLRAGGHADGACGVEVRAQSGLNIPLIALHPFVFYCGIVGDVTPPVGLTTFAAAAISGGEAIATSIQGSVYALQTVILPFICVDRLLMVSMM